MVSSENIWTKVVENKNIISWISIKTFKMLGGLLIVFRTTRTRESVYFHRTSWSFKIKHRSLYILYWKILKEIAHKTNFIFATIYPPIAPSYLCQQYIIVFENNERWDDQKRKHHTNHLITTWPNNSNPFPLDHWQYITLKILL